MLLDKPARVKVVEVEVGELRSEALVQVSLGPVCDPPQLAQGAAGLLRNRIVKAALAIAGGMVLGFVFFGPIWAVVTHPFCSAVISGHTGCKTQGDQLVVTGIFDPFMVRVQVAFFVGLIATSPVWLCVVLVEIAEVIVWANDRRRARIPDPYAGLADDDLAPLEMDDDLRAAPSDHSLS